MRKLGCLAATGFAAMAVTSTPAVTEGERAALDNAIEAWQQLDSANYSFDFQNLCNCQPGAIGKMRVDVSAGQIKNVRYAQEVYELHIVDDEKRYHLIHSSGSDVPDEFAAGLIPVGALLQEIKKKIADPLAEYEAEFDTTTGVPCRVFFNFSGPAVDDELEIVLSNFEFEGEVKPATLGCAAGEAKFVHFSHPPSPEAASDN